MKENCEERQQYHSNYSTASKQNFTLANTSANTSANTNTNTSAKTNSNAANTTPSGKKDIQTQTSNSGTKQALLTPTQNAVQGTGRFTVANTITTTILIVDMHMLMMYP